MFSISWILNINRCDKALLCFFTVLVAQIWEKTFSIRPPSQIISGMEGNASQANIYSFLFPGMMFAYPHAVRIGEYFLAVTVIASTGQELTQILHIWQYVGTFSQH